MREGRRAAVMVWHYHDAAKPAAATPVSLKIKAIPSGVRRVLVRRFVDIATIMPRQSVSLLVLSW